MYQSLVNKCPAEVKDTEIIFGRIMTSSLSLLNRTVGGGGESIVDHLLCNFVIVVY